MNSVQELNFDHKENIYKFFIIALGTVILGLSIGGLLDSLIRKLQKGEEDWKERKYARALTFFLLQASLNITILIAFSRSTELFIPWFQLSVSGALFSVLLFASQRNLVDNVLRLTNF